MKYNLSPECEGRTASSEDARIGSTPIGDIMKKYDPLWNEINNLLSLLDGCEVVSLVRDYYAKYNNSAPPGLLKSHMEKLQKLLDEAEK